MEDVLEAYHLPYDPRFPLVCMDESCKQLVGEVAPELAMAPGRPRRIDHEYVRHGVAEIFLEVEPLTGRRHVTAGENRTRRDWALFIRAMLDERYPEAIKVRLVLDNLNTHTTASLYETFPAPEARRLAERIEFHYTPKHGSWLNVAEIELSALASQCLDRRIACLPSLAQEIEAWQTHRNNRSTPIDWQFTTTDARIKLKRLYPNL
jgi:DDE superfamily endonuclease